MLYLPAADLQELMGTILVMSDTARMEANDAPDTVLTKKGRKIMAVRQAVPARQVTPVPTMRPGDCPPVPEPCIGVEDGVLVWRPWL